MTQGTYLSWEEMQRLALPPDATMLVPPPFQPADVAALAAGPPRTDWLDEGFAPPLSAQRPPTDAVPVDPAAEQAAAERAEYGPGPVRLLSSLIAVNAVLAYAHEPRTQDDEEQPPRKLPDEPEPQPEQP
jgi:hypothetical protein